MSRHTQSPAVLGEHLLELPLEVRGPRTPSLSGNPVESLIEWHNDGRGRTGVWECTPGTFESERDGITEVMHFIAGDATVTDDDGVYEIGPGTVLTVPDGWRGTWEIRQTVRKVYAIWSTTPDARLRG